MLNHKTMLHCKKNSFHRLSSSPAILMA